MSNIPPISWAMKNVYNAARNPSAVHCRNTDLVEMYGRYLFEDLISCYDFPGLPETWASNYFKYCLFLCGYVCIFETDKYGVIPQQATLGGFDVFYQPAFAIVTNPRITGARHLDIGINCEIVKMQPDYLGAWDLVSTYADLLGLCLESAGMNLVNSKLAYVFAAANKAQAESFKKLFDEIASGNPAAFADKTLFDENGKKQWDVFANNLRQNFIGKEIMELAAYIEDIYKTTIGIPTANDLKKERLNTKETMIRSFDAKNKAQMWADTINEGLTKVNNMFGLNIRCVYKYAEAE